MTARFTPPRLGFIDTSPLRLQVSVLLTSLMAFATAGKFSAVVKASLAMRRAYKSIMRADIHNRNLERKLHMLACRAWRARVLSDLGGLCKLALWDAAMKRAAIRTSLHGSPHLSRLPAAPGKPAPAWRQAKEALRRVHIRDCAKACANPRIVRDPFRVDFEGEFRLAPLPRLSVRGRRGVILSDGPDYDYDAMRRVQFRGVRSVAVVWPCEFYAAMRLKRRPARPKPIVERARKPARTDRPALPVSLLQPVPKPVLNPMLYAPP